MVPPTVSLTGEPETVPSKGVAVQVMVDVEVKDAVRVSPTPADAPRGDLELALYLEHLWWLAAPWGWGCRHH